jgi:DNA-binding transcriptional ArsR family regulator
MTSKKEKEARRVSLRPHPARDQILDVMRSYGKPISPTQVARITGGTLGSTAYHIRTLIAAGVVELADEGRVRGAIEHYYAIVPSSDGETRLTDPVDQLLRLCDALTVPDAEGGFPQQAVIDEAAREQLIALIEGLRPDVQAIVAAATARSRGR